MAPMIDSSITSMEQLGRKAQALGITASDLTKFEYAAERVGASTEDMDQALSDFYRNENRIYGGQWTMLGIECIERRARHHSCPAWRYAPYLMGRRRAFAPVGT